MVKRMKKKAIPEEEIVAQEEVDGLQGMDGCGIRKEEQMVEEDNIKQAVIPETVVNAIVEDDNPLI